MLSGSQLSGILLRASAYQPFGQQHETMLVTSPGESKGYIGERNGPGHLMYLHARYYDAALGPIRLTRLVGPPAGRRRHEPLCL